MKNLLLLSLLASVSSATALAQADKTTTLAASEVQTAGGRLAGAALPSGIRVFRGVPYATPPVGKRRWQAPQPTPRWAGVREARQFGPRPMQLSLFSDMVFRSGSISEDCLYLNVWTGAKTTSERRPVLVYFYGGGFVAGDSSELRYDGESLARQGLVMVTVNYRLGVFGFFVHPELIQESAHHAAGNYGLLDQAAALRWVQANIAAFGGDPQRIVIGGESAGSFSVSAQLVSPLAKSLLTGAIGESGSLLGLQPLPTLAQAAPEGAAFAQGLGAPSLAALRALQAPQLLAATSRPDAPRFRPVVDGYFLPEQPAALYAASQQAPVPLLAGWNSQEMNYQALLGQQAPTVATYRAAVRRLYPDHADEVLAQYPATTALEAEQAATDLASDRFIAYGTWRWTEAHARTQPVYRYLFAQPRPALVAATAPGLPAPTNLPLPGVRGAVHSAEIEYALGNLAANRVYAWTPDDYRVSAQMQQYFANFVRTGNPNGAGLPAWPALRPEGSEILQLDAHPHLLAAPSPGRYRLLGQLAEEGGQ